MNKNRLEYHQPVTSASTQPIWPCSLPPTSPPDRAARRGSWVPGTGAEDGVDRAEVSGQDRVEHGQSRTTLSSPLRVGCEDGNLLIGCPCQKTKEERLKCQHLVRKKFLSGTFGKIPREMQLEPRRAEWKGLWL